MKKTRPRPENLDQRRNPEMKAIIKKIAQKIKKTRERSSKYTNKLFEELPNGISLLDIGAAGGIEPRWHKVCEHITYIGVEPDKRTNKHLKTESKALDTYILDKFAWDTEEEIEFYLCKKSHVSSAYRPNRILLDNYFDSDRFDITKIEKIKTSRLDKQLEKFKIDFIKLDIQGAELKALKGLGGKLKACLGLEVEVEFSELYKSQPLFSEVNEYLMGKGFYFCDFYGLSRWERNRRGFGRCMFGNGLWLREVETIQENEDNYYKYAAICSLYGKIDAAISSIERLKKSTKSRNFISTLLKAKREQDKRRDRFKTISRLWEFYSPNTKISLQE